MSAFAAVALRAAPKGGLLRAAALNCRGSAIRSASTAAGSNAASSAEAIEAAAFANTKRPDPLLKFQNQATVKQVHHYTSYFLAAGLPAALLLGSPISTIVDLGLGIVIPLHFHIGMRSVIIDYVHPPVQQKLAIGMLATFTVLTAVGLTLFNVKDVGLTQGVKELFIEQEAPAEEKKAAKQLH